MKVFMTRVLAALVGAAALSLVWLFNANPFGYCTLAGCASHLYIDTAVPWFEGITYEVEVCLDDECWEGVTVANDTREDDSGTIGLERDGSISIHLGEEDRPTTSAVTVVVTADGVEMERYAGSWSSTFANPTGAGASPPATSVWSRCRGFERTGRSGQLAAAPPAASHALSRTWPITSTDWAPAIA